MNTNGKYNKLTEEELDKQNKSLEMIDRHLENLKTTSVKTNEELKNQSNYAENLESGINDASDRVNNLSDKTKKETKYTSWCKDCGLIPIIIFLSVVIVIAIVIIILA